MIAKFNFQKTPQECQKKYYNLVRTYKSSQVRANSVKFPYFEDVDEILNVKTEIFVDPEVEKEFRELQVLKQQSSQNNSSKKEVTKVIDAEEPPEIIDKKDIWSIKETEILIELYKKHKDGLGKHNWNLISVELRNLGFNKEPRKCMKKIFNLRRTYKKIISKGKEGTARFPFVRKLDEIFGKPLDHKEEDADEEDISYIYSDDDGLNEWSDHEIQELIKAISQVKSLYSFSLDQPEFWETISAILVDSGVDRNSVECDNEFQELVNVFEKSKINGSSSHFSYFEDLEKVLAISNNEEITNIEFLDAELLPDTSLDQVEIDLQSFNTTEDTSSHSKDKITTIWKPSQTLNLISLFYQHKDIIEDENDKWYLISEHLHKSPEDCKIKWKSLLDRGKLVFKGVLDEVHAPYYGTLIDFFGESLFKEEKEKGT